MLGYEGNIISNKNIFHIYCNQQVHILARKKNHCYKNWMSISMKWLMHVRFFLVVYKIKRQTTISGCVMEYKRWYCLVTCKNFKTKTLLSCSVNYIYFLYFSLYENILYRQKEQHNLVKYSKVKRKTKWAIFTTHTEWAHEIYSTWMHFNHLEKIKYLRCTIN